jgi:hypothetical protein
MFISSQLLVIPTPTLGFHSSQVQLIKWYVLAYYDRVCAKPLTLLVRSIYVSSPVPTFHTSPSAIGLWHQVPQLILPRQSRRMTMMVVKT